MFRETAHASGQRAGRVLTLRQLLGQKVSGDVKKQSRVWRVAVALPVAWLERGVFIKQERLSITRQRWSGPSKRFTGRGADGGDQMNVAT